MAKKARNNGTTLIDTADYRHNGKRKNIPPAKMERQGTVPKAERAKYHYNPHLSPELRFDPDGGPDALPALIATAQKRPLSETEAKALAQALKNQHPWLEWAAKKEEHDRGALSVNPVALHLHERISAKAIVRAAMRQDVERSLFAATEGDYAKAVQFYKHEIDWTNRLILGDSLEVMSSLSRREALAGTVQMIYMDPPYGIKFGSNFQAEVGKRDVKDKDADLTREPETIRAYRDVWHLGIHSYLSYLRDRLLAAKELLADTGSIFVQISDANLHRIRCLLDDVFGADNLCGLIAFRTTGGQSTSLLSTSTDFLCWYAKDRDKAKTRFQPVTVPKTGGTGGSGQYTLIEPEDCSTDPIPMTDRQESGADPIPAGFRVLAHDTLYSQGAPSDEVDRKFEWRGRVFVCPANTHWKPGVKSGRMARLAAADRVMLVGNTPRYKRFLDDYAVFEIDNVWDDTARSGFAGKKVYIVETSTKVVERCMLMTTRPGDLVLDPTCGSGTTAYVAEQWGRRWITIDTSRVAVSIARQRLLTARFDYYKTRSDGPSGNVDNPASGFVYKKLPHITLGSIAQNERLDPIIAQHAPVLDKTLHSCNKALREVGPDVRRALAAKLKQKTERSGKRSITEADRRRWILPPEHRNPDTKYAVDARFAGWYHWEVPFDADSEWPSSLKEAVTAYRAAWSARTREVNACIAACAQQEELVDQPEVIRGVTRVTGPFTVEGVIPEEMALTDEGIKDLTPNEGDGDTDAASDLQNIHAYLKGMIDAVGSDGLTFPNNKKGTFAEVTPLYEGGTLDTLHAEGFWSDDSKKAEPVAIAFGPQYGPITARQVEDCIHAATRYRHLVLAGFAFAPEAAAIVAEQSHPKLTIHLANIRPDMNPAMKGLLKETPNSQLFSVFGLPEIEVAKVSEGKYTVTLNGVDIFDPVENTVRSTGASKVAAWFLDSDFDNRCFCTTQAFFPNQDAWGKIAKALGAAGNEEAFEAFKGTESLPFEAGEHKRVAVKVIDPRGNEVMTVRKLS